MATSPYPATKAKFTKRFPDHLKNALSNSSNLSVRGSEWDKRHLESCRVLLKDQAVLKVLKPHFDLNATEKAKLEDAVGSITKRDIQRGSPSQRDLHLRARATGTPPDPSIPAGSSPLAAAASSSPWRSSQEEGSYTEQDVQESRSKAEILTASMATEFISCVV